jgi:hypothetical protein
MQTRSILLPSLLVSVPLLLPGCASISGSFKSASDSVAGSLEAIASPFESSSRSSGSGGGTQASSNYRRDVENYTLAYLDAPDQGEYLRGLASIAGLHGITHWEADPGTLDAIRELDESGRLDEGDRQRLRRELSPLGEAAVASTLGEDG